MPVVARGFCQYAAWNTSDSWSPARPFGLVTGVETPDSTGGEHIDGLGGESEVIGGLVSPEFTIDFLPCDESILPFAFRGREGYPCSAVQQWFAKLGVDRDYVYARCKVATLVLAVEVGKPLSATATVRAESRSPGPLARPTMLERGRPFLWYGSGAVTLNGEPYTTQGWQLTVANDPSPDTDLDGGATGALRLPKRLLEGDESVSLDLLVKGTIPESVLGPYDDRLPVDLAWSTSIASARGDLLSFSVGGLAQFRASRRAEPGGRAQVYRYSFEAARNALAAGYTYTAP